MPETLAGMQLQERLGVIAGVGIHAVDHAELVDVPGGLRQEFGYPLHSSTAAGAGREGQQDCRQCQRNAVGRDHPTRLGPP